MTALVTVSVAAMLAMPAVGCAQERNTPTNPPAKGEKSQGGESLYRAQDRDQAAPGHKSSPDGDDTNPRRLESVTWNSVNHQLTWVISKGAKEPSGFKALKNDNYEISMDTATMTYNGQTRRFSKEEAANVHVLMDVIAKYAVDSTIWWDEGQGEPLDGGPAPNKQDQKKQPTPTRQGSAAVLHISLRTPDASADAIQSRIDQLERQVEQLKRLKQLKSVLDDDASRL